MQPRSTILARIASAVLGLAVGLVGAELTFGQLRPVVEAPKSEPVLYSIEVRDAAGALLASPLLVGQKDKPVHLNLARGANSDSVEMSLDLHPQSKGGNNVCVGYRVSIGDGNLHSGKIGTKYGVKRSVNVKTGQGESVRLSVVVAKARTRAFKKLLASLRKPSA